VEIRLCNAAANAHNYALAERRIQLEDYCAGHSDIAGASRLAYSGYNHDRFAPPPVC